LPAGRQDASYSTKVNAFDWRHFYQELSGGAFFELIRERVKTEYDYILIDSRTGVSGTSGICTIQMPDDLVVCFTPSEQNVRGSVAVATYVESQWRNVAYRDAGERRILPVLTLVEVSEKDKLDTTHEYVRELFRKFIVIKTTSEENYWKGA
jgi:MinD-like ATPase involved in chromosome partitioning or flagellar assembly